MKILALFDTMDVPETELIHGIAALGHEVRIGCNPAGYNQHRLPNFVSQFSLSCKSRLDIHSIKQLRAELRQADYDLVHAFTGRTLSAVLFAAIGLNPRPRILGYRGALGNVGRFDPSVWISFRHPWVDGIFCVSDAVKEYLLAAGFAPEKIVRIYKGHNPEWYYRDRYATRGEFGIPSDAFVVGCVANMRPNKGMDDLLAAFGQLEQESKVHLVLIGSMERAPDLPEFKRLAHPERVHFLGFSTDVPTLLPLLDCMVTPTKFVEGFPKSTIEAMCLQIPTIVTAVGGMKELVRDSIDGLVVPPCNPTRLSQAIAAIRRDEQLRTRLGTAGLKRIAESFSATVTIEQTLQWYESLLNSVRS